MAIGTRLTKKWSTRLPQPLVVLMTGLLFAAAARGAPPEQPTSAAIDYQHEIAPILAARCFRCHGSKKQEGGLRLDRKARILQGGDSGPVFEPGESVDSRLLLRVTSTDDDVRMPPEGKPLGEKQIALLRSWIDQGATGIPADGPDPAVQEHWAFRPITRPVPPAGNGIDHIRSPIDRFVLAKLAERNVAPSPAASRTTLIRRLHFDLIGLPPEWERVEQFLLDRRADAYERLVDELLASPHYGERWGRHWLDVARYADSSGYEADKPREIWPYRDWVIAALNRNMPFDEFVIEQFAGDLLPGATTERIIATGFHCNAILDPGVRWESIVDRVNTTGAVFLGLTVGCAQCHSHKSDPITQREYYQLYAFFNDATVDTLELALTGKAGQAEAAATSLVMKQTPQPTHIFVRGDPAQPGPKVTAGVPAFLHGLDADDADTSKGFGASNGSGSANRLDLARWLVAADNPLTPRVTVNRVWQRYFGLGLVDTESDFGRQTPEPLHHELLDFLASEFVANGWDLKRLHREIVTSATYRQSSRQRHELQVDDPRNRLLARQRRLRLEAELIRDASLTAGGLLSHQLGGPSVFPHQPEGVLQNRATPATWTMSEGRNRYRRGMYTWVWRLTQHPQLPLFDAPDGITACTRRHRSNVPVQALTLLNDPTFLEAARGLARRALHGPQTSDDGRVVCLFRTSLSRDPLPTEIELIRTLLNQQRTSLARQMEDARNIVGEGADAADSMSEAAAWVVVCRAIMNLDEFITRE